MSDKVIGSEMRPDDTPGRRDNTEDVAFRSELGRQLRDESARLRNEVALAVTNLEREQTAALASLYHPLSEVSDPHTRLAAAEPERLLRASPLMDPKWYRRRYPDIDAAGADPVSHYLEHGWREGRMPGPAFDGSRYLEANPDLAAAGVNPLVHYLQCGAAEGRPLRPTEQPLVAAAAAHPVALSSEESRQWFYVGDTVDWMRDHAHLTGVGRVTSELLFEALDTGVRPCVADPDGGLQPLQDAAPLFELARRTGRQMTALPVTATDPPQPGDHVFFTGVVWTDVYSAIFRRLHADGVRFSVLIHDIIPLLDASVANSDHSRMFSEWLATTMALATAVFVSNDGVARDVARWTIAAQSKPNAQIRRIQFGHRSIAPSRGAASNRLRGLDGAGFVLSVGTIDGRKNQSLLVRVWSRLLDRRGAAAVPLLVLAGRDDLGLTREPGFQSLVAIGKLLQLQDLSDAEVAALYQSCLFTVFPSRSEGYGLPVAESLAYGTPCLSADLPAVRAHAGDLPWYFDSGNEDAALSAIEHLLDHPQERRKAIERIARNRTPTTWRETFADMRGTVAELLTSPEQLLRDVEPHVLVGQASCSPLEVLKKSERWCSSVEPQVSIIIVNWNAGQLTRDCIRQIWAATEGVRYEIIIADNGSADAERAPLKDLGTGVRLIEIGCNRFFGEANNIGVEAASGEFVCLLNNDAFVQEGWLKALVRPLDEDPLIGATGPLFLFPDGRIQEAGGHVDQDGYPVRAGRESDHLPDELNARRSVDYISAAALLVRRTLFIEVGGFDLSFEPVYYEDTDLCFKVRAFGRAIVFCPDARVVHIEGASANGDAAAERRRRHLGDLNRGKFVARWGEYLRRREPGSLKAVRDSLQRRPVLKRDAHSGRRAVIYTPEPLTPGGGERYLLTLAEHLLCTHDVTIATPHPYSRVRVLSLGGEFGLDLSGVELSADPGLSAAGTPDVQVVMGNHIVPPVPARGRVNLFHCQFPFPLSTPPGLEARDWIGGYDRIIVNSRYTALHCEAALNGLQLPDMPISVLAPPVQPVEARSGRRHRRRILSVGRFFVGGHSKRQDRLIAAFKTLVDDHGIEAELHLAGSSHPAHENMAYLADLMVLARGYSIHFHVNIPAEDLAGLYASCGVYWHGTGLESDLVSQPWAAEHFGISIVEAMSAGVTPFALASGGAREIISSGVDGYLYRDLDSLVALTLAYLKLPDAEAGGIAERARTRSRTFEKPQFIERLDSILRDVGSVPGDRLSNHDFSRPLG